MIPIFRRELLIAARRDRVHSQRGYFAGLLLAMVLGTFAAWYYWGNGQVSNVVMEEVAQRAFLLILGVHAVTMMGPVVLQATTAIAGEKDRRTVEFLLITRLTSAEIILEKLAARLVLFVTTIAAGLPVMLLLHLLGGIDLRVILLNYAGMATTAFFLASLSIWFSVTQPNARRAASQGIGAAMMWLIGPTFLPLILPQFGLHLPAWAAAANGWLIASSPMSILMKLAMGVGASVALIDAVEWMCGLQVIGGLFLLLGSIVRLRSAYRANVSDETRARGLARKRPVWRLRPRPPVGDDPILWREKYTSRSTGVDKFVGAVFNLGLLLTLTYGTYHYARPALLEVWRHGYGSGGMSAEAPELNLFVGLFRGGPAADQPDDAARCEFNLFVRWITVPLTMFLTLAAAGSTCEILMRERARETWTSLLATPMTASRILKAVLSSAAWRLREFFAIILVLWTLGLIVGAIHPLGYLLSLMVLTSSTWLLETWGILAALRSKDRAGANNWIFVLTLGAMLCSNMLPVLLPNRFSSVLLGSGSPMFVLALSLASYSEVSVALHHADYPILRWVGINTGEGPLPVLVTCMLGIIGPTLGGRWCWRYALAHFDRLVGRPWRAGSMAQDRPGVRRAEPVAIAPERAEWLAAGHDAAPG